MTTVGLAILGFLVSFLFQARMVPWINEASSPKFALLGLLGSVMAGFIIRALLEVEETFSELRLIGPFLGRLNDEELQGLIAKLESLQARTGGQVSAEDHPFLREAEKQLAEIERSQATIKE